MRCEFPIAWADPAESQRFGVVPHSFRVSERPGHVRTGPTGGWDACQAGFTTPIARGSHDVPPGRPLQKTAVPTAPDWGASGRSRCRFEIGRNGRREASFYAHSGSRRDPATCRNGAHSPSTGDPIPAWRVRHSSVSRLQFRPGVYLEQRIYTTYPDPSNRGRNVLYNTIRLTVSSFAPEKPKESRFAEREGRRMSRATCCLFPKPIGRKTSRASESTLLVDEFY